MRYLLDTDTCIYTMNQKPEQVFRRVERLKPGDVGISSITYYELALGIAKSHKAAQNRERLEGFIALVPVLPFDQKAADAAATIRLDLQKAGTPIGAYDLLMAAHAFSLGLTLVTNNLREFLRIQGLRVENWLDEG
ncbi:MAG: type II toxin-antitoxin system VapC family toxin [Meiothermus sp.]|uniref:type II toxin-antitoxin system tRNA(fMet)-specific endonuclease VapC n=1 Tax=Meiothermus sp. TaxID=1955249 RepID=UPI0025F2BBAD|nr:type II toxin-antitoxin system VapC family toxin [Meiothermus sp.]MCS7068489.1 type II toxin-antitoxin system VapC family toxin [Meiothermus sp.]MCX7601309.1 type II toxin-antitoxin system VapC family toxin [Meiothermus sp.]MDW8425471.1 type II toxin-antitoxin system VapC family toxin [Meiothermus sp.]